MGDPPVRLSVCIPTYNFGAFIGQTLESITANLEPGVEIVILDGGSTDGTGGVVAEWQRRYPQIEYHRQDFRGGIDRDIARAVRLSRGTYAWLFSADDIMRPGAIATVLRATESDLDVYLCEHTLCTENLEPIADHPIFNGVAPGTVFDLGDTRQRKAYFEHARTSEAFFSYLAGPVFKRSVWDAAADIPESFYSTCWGLAGRLLSRVPRGLTVQYTGEQLILKRSGVDSFMDRGIVHRLSITVDGFAHVAETIFGHHSWETTHIRRVTRHEAAFRFRRLVSVKMIVVESLEPRELPEFYRVVRRLYTNAGAINALRYLIIRCAPVSVLVGLRSLKNRATR